MDIEPLQQCSANTIQLRPKSMWRSGTLILLATVFGGNCLAGTSQDAAIVGSLRPIVKKYASDESDFDWKEAGNGGYIIRFFVDVTGDDNPELFVTSSLVADGNGSRWTVYDVAKDGSMSQCAQDIRLPMQGFSKRANEPGLEYIDAVDYEARRGKPESDWVTPIIRCSFVFPNITINKEDIPDAEVPALHVKFLDSVVKSEAILLSDFLAGGKDWEPVGQWKISMSDGKLWRDSDWDRAKLNKDFTPKVAIEALEKTAGTYRRETENSSKEELGKTEANGANENGSGFVLQRNWLVTVSLVVAGIAFGFYYKSRSKTR